jgi:hypothetical protein
VSFKDEPDFCGQTAMGAFNNSCIQVLDYANQITPEAVRKFNARSHILDGIIKGQGNERAVFRNIGASSYAEWSATGMSVDNLVSKTHLVSDSGNAAMSDGTSLQQGSAAYEEFVADRKGLDVFEQEQRKRSGQMTVESILEADTTDKFHKELTERNAGHGKALSEKSDDSVSRATAQKTVRQNLKMAYREEARQDAIASAERTEDESDDKVAKGRKGKVIIERNIYNDGMAFDDYLPGH